jgi:hypothetical protein
MHNMAGSGSPKQISGHPKKLCLGVLEIVEFTSLDPYIYHNEYERTKTLYPSLPLDAWIGNAFANAAHAAAATEKGGVQVTNTHTHRGPEREGLSRCHGSMSLR